MMMNPLKVNTGLFSFFFSEGDLRKIHIHGKEIIQRIYFALRDINFCVIEFDDKTFLQGPGTGSPLSISLEVKDKKIPRRLKRGKSVIKKSDQILTEPYFIIQACRLSDGSVLRNHTAHLLIVVSLHQ